MAKRYRLPNGRFAKRGTPGARPIAVRPVYRVNGKFASKATYLKHQAAQGNLPEAIETTEMAEQQYRRDKAAERIAATPDIRDVYFDKVSTPVDSGDLTPQEAFQLWVGAIRDQGFGPMDLHASGETFYEYLRDMLREYEWWDEIDWQGSNLYEHILYGSADGNA